MVFKNELYSIHLYGRVRGKCDGRLQTGQELLMSVRNFSQCAILRSTLIYKDHISLMAAATVDGLLSGGRFSYRNFHRIISCGTSSGDGKSSCMIHWYCIVEFNISCTKDGRHQSKQRCGSG